MEVRPSSYGGQLIYCISSHRQPTSGGLPAWGLAMGVENHDKKNKLFTNIQKRHRTWTDSLDE
jgi:hypothetical protein